MVVEDEEPATLACISPISINDFPLALAKRMTQKCKVSSLVYCADSSLATPEFDIPCTPPISNNANESLVFDNRQTQRCTCSRRIGNSEFR